MTPSFRKIQNIFLNIRGAAFSDNTQQYYDQGFKNSEENVLINGFGEFRRAEVHSIARFTVIEKKLLQSSNKFSLGGEDAKRETPKLMGISLSITGNTPMTV